MIWLKLAWRELINNRKFSLFFVLNLAFGLVGFISIDTFKSSLRQDLLKGSKEIHSADFSIETKQRELSPSEAAAIVGALPPQTLTAKTTEFLSMAAVPNRSRLVAVQAVSGLYPLYGQIKLRSGGDMVSSSKKEILSRNKVWVYPEVLSQLKAKIGDTLKLGDAVFEISDVVEQDAKSGASFLSFVPKVYIGEGFVEATKLIQPNSRYSIERYYRLPAEAELDAVTLRLKETLTSPEVKIETHFEASEQLERTFTTLTDYLGLVALVALFFASIAAAYFFRNFILSHVIATATLMSLGARRRDTRMVYLLELFMLSLGAAALAILFTYFTLPLMPILSRGLLPIEINPRLNLHNMLVAIGIGILGSFLSALPSLAQIKDLKPAALFQDSEIALAGSSSIKNFLLYLPSLLVYWGLAMWVCSSVRLGSTFFAVFLGAALLFGFGSTWILQLIEKNLRQVSVFTKIALRNLVRNSVSTSSCFLTISLGAMLLGLIPQLNRMIIEDVRNPPGLVQPSLFLFDIQEEQLAGVKAFFEEHHTTLDQLSPMIRANLTRVNGEPIERYDPKTALTREQQRERWLKNRGQNLSYRAHNTSASERIFKGKDFSGEFRGGANDRAEVSLERRYAEGLGIGVGDSIDFEVQGVAILGKVVNLRSIKWTSFQPNFFVQFQPGVLEQAPKIFVASVPPLTEDVKLALQGELVEKFSNVSVIDISRTITRILIIIDRMSAMIRLMAYLSILAGLVVLYSIARHQVFMRRWDTNLMKVLGGSYSNIRFTTLTEFGTLSGLAALLGTSGSVLISFAMAKLIFDSPFQFYPGVLLLSAGAVWLLSLSTVWFATTRILKEKPLGLLNSV